MQSAKNSTQKIFVVGFNKTGTNSIHRLIEDHGIPGIHWDRGKLAVTMLSNAVHGRPLVDGYNPRIRLFSDLYYRNETFCLEANALFRQMNMSYPDSLFLYNTRPMGSWIKSRLKHKSPTTGKALIDTYRNFLGTEDISVIINYWRKTRLRHEEDLRDYFKGSPRYAEIDITDECFIDKLSGFLGFRLDSEKWKIYNKTPRIANEE